MVNKFLIGFAGAGVLAVWFVFTPVSFEKNISPIHFEIQKGFSTKTIISKLKKQNLIRPYFPYTLLYRWTVFQAGEYRLSKNMSAYHIFQKLTQGKVITYKVTFTEGMNMFEMAQILEETKLITAQEFLNVCKNPQWIQSLLGESLESLEGYLYPETYQLTKGMSAQTLVQKMVKEFLKNYNSLSSSIGSLFSRHQVVILSSLVEKETGASWERPRIASVFHNRFKIGMKFQSDPTILYGILRKTGKMPNNIRKKDITAPTPYNTYTVKGFPKGPIANPGKDSLNAVLNPEKTSYYYFVSRNDGSHVFSENFKDHNKAVNQYQRKLKINP